MAGEYNINPVYQGGFSTMDPGASSYGSIISGGYGVEAKQFGLTTDPRTANVLQQVSGKISTGLTNIEVEGISPAVFESIPKQHLKEVNRLAKLTGMNVSLHGPSIEASGISDKGFSETGRKEAEKEMILAVERGHELDPQGNIPITFHSTAGLPGAEMIKTKDKEEIKEAFVINTESGSMMRMPIKEKFFPGEKSLGIQKEIDEANEESWTHSLSNLAYNINRANELISESEATKKIIEKEKVSKSAIELDKDQKRMEHVYEAGTSFFNDSYRSLKQLYNKAYENAKIEDNKQQIQDLDILNKKISKSVSEIEKDPKSFRSIELKQAIMEDGLKTLNSFTDAPPQILKPLNDFAKERTTQTFANVALHGFKKFGDKAPIISIENPPAGAAFSTGKELKQVVEDTRKKFVKTAVKQEIMSQSDAEKQAEKLIGVTWDVGHINMLRKKGYEKEDILKETEAIKPLLKHVHLSDNFGFEHTELPMGMGNVPMKEIMEKLGKEGFEARKIIEAAQWYEHFKTSPVTETLDAFGAPIYSGGRSPYWNQTLGLYQDYSGSFGEIFPPINYETFGGSFSQLPSELGGQRPGVAGSRMSGASAEV